MASLDGVANDGFNQGIDILNYFWANLKTAQLLSQFVGLHKLNHLLVAVKAVGDETLLDNLLVNLVDDAKVEVFS